MVFLPCLMGALAPTWNASARGTYFGFTLAHTRAHFVRALLEGSAYAVRDITDQMQNIGLSLEQIRIVGGGAQSRFWRQIKADVTGLPVALPQTTETTALGAGMLAMAGAGLSGSLEEAASQTVQIVDVFEPNPKSQEFVMKNIISCIAPPTMLCCRSSINLPASLAMNLAASRPADPQHE